MAGSIWWWPITSITIRLIPALLPTAKDYCVPKVFAGRVCCLFRNLGGEGRPGCFEDKTLLSGLGRVPGPGLGVVCLAVFDGDGWPDGSRESFADTTAVDCEVALRKGSGKPVSGGG